MNVSQQIRYRFQQVLSLCACIFGVCLLAHPASSEASSKEDKTIRARIIRHPSGAVLNGHASKVVGTQLELRTPIGTTILIPFHTIESVEFELSDDLAAASEAYRAGDLERALMLYRQLRGFESLVVLPGSNIGQEFLNWADTLRQLRRYNEAAEVLASIDFSENDEGRSRALLIQAFIHCDRNEIDEAAQLMEDFVPIDRENVNFPLDRIVRARIHLARDETHLAALVVGESLASAPIESPVYPELLYLAAQTYEKMKTKSQNPADAEQVAMIDKLMGESVDYDALVEGVRTHLSFIFPNSYWAQQSPGNVDELLARAANIKLNESGGDTADQEANQGQSAEPEATPENPFKRFLSPTSPTKQTN